MAPNLPTAALTPCAKPRTRVGKASAGMMKVVGLAPKLKKNCGYVSCFFFGEEGGGAGDIGVFYLEEGEADEFAGGADVVVAPGENGK